MIVVTAKLLSVVWLLSLGCFLSVHRVAAADTSRTPILLAEAASSLSSWLRGSAMNEEGHRDLKKKKPTPEPTKTPAPTLTSSPTATPTDLPVSSSKKNNNKNKNQATTSPSPVTESTKDSKTNNNKTTSSAPTSLPTPAPITPKPHTKKKDKGTSSSSAAPTTTTSNDTQTLEAAEEELIEDEIEILDAVEEMLMNETTTNVASMNMTDDNQEYDDIYGNPKSSTSETPTNVTAEEFVSVLNDLIGTSTTNETTSNTTTTETPTTVTPDEFVSDINDLIGNVTNTTTDIDTIDTSSSNTTEVISWMNETMAELENSTQMENTTQMENSTDTVDWYYEENVDDYYQELIDYEQDVFNTTDDIYKNEYTDTNESTPSYEDYDISAHTTEETLDVKRPTEDPSIPQDTVTINTTTATTTSSSSSSEEDYSSPFTSTSSSYVSAEDESHTLKVMAISMIVAMLIFMIFTAYQVSENPDGVYASCCRLSVTVVACMLKGLLTPCRLICCKPTGHHIVGSDYREPYRGRRGHMELT